MTGRSSGHSGPSGPGTSDPLGSPAPTVPGAPIGPPDASAPRLPDDDLLAAWVEWCLDGPATGGAPATVDAALGDFVLFEKFLAERGFAIVHRLAADPLSILSPPEKG